MFASTVMWLPFLVFWAVVQILKPLLHCQNGPVAIRISGLSLHLSTTSLNSLPPFLLRGVPQITRERKGGTVRRLSWIWDAGAVAAVGGMAVAQGVLLWAAVKGGTALWASLATSEATSYAMNLAKRAEIPLDSTSFSTGSAPPSDGLLLRPLLLRLFQYHLVDFMMHIPGITTPLSTLPMLLLALEHIPLLSTGIHLYLFLPTLYVSLPASTPATSQSPFTDLRVASAGVWHNLGMAGAVWMLSDEGGGVSRWMLEKGAMDGVDSGVTVVEVDEHSPLHSHLPPNSLITHLNDLELDSSDSPLALWRSYLSRPSPSTSVEDYTNLGWCLPSSSFSASPDLPNSNCCASTPVNSASHSLCFEAASPSSSEPFFACLDPVPFFPPSETIPRRCLDQSSCLNAGDETVCARPASKEQVLRIGVAADDTDGDGRRTVIWQGDSQDVLRQGQLGSFVLKSNTC
ncbi:SPOSA6832_00924 [Sporobolomyces salmonicolor]|uniref:SPOSA6832_00924-mRNA-1:cds n=1 Tax=Sporidiobolus salmonicolor TaxID=5005 RepID=A0A0D6EIH9_SPOSA|nr:SPOSA6832_00924 [Sporobolomyces salmonicolor]